MNYEVLIKLVSPNQEISYNTTDLGVHDSLAHWLPLDDDVESITITRKQMNESILDNDPNIKNAVSLGVNTPDGWTENVKLIIDPSGRLDHTRFVVLTGGSLDKYMIDIDHQAGDKYVLSYKSETIGHLHQEDKRITGKIDISTINDDFGVFIVSHLAHVPSACYLLKIRPKSKYDPRKPEFLTIDEFSD